MPYFRGKVVNLLEGIKKKTTLYRVGGFNSINMFLPLFLFDFAYFSIFTIFS